MTQKAENPQPSMEAPGAPVQPIGPVPTGLIPLNDATADRLRRIAEAAYRRAQGRNFAPERAQPDANVFDAVRGHIEALQSAGKRVLLALWSSGSRDRWILLLRRSPHSPRGPRQRRCEAP